MRVLLAPDKFKGTLTAPAAALALADGLRRIHPRAVVTSCPIADGGSGTLEALLDAKGGTKSFVNSCDPWGKPFRMPIASLGDGTVCVETATASTGDPLRADSEGVGMCIRRAVELGGNGRVVVAVGGTASTDGGIGLAKALGWRFLDGFGDPLPPGPAQLIHLRYIESPTQPLQATVTALCDVDTPLLGPNGSARRFAPQKGADPDQVETLERGLENLSMIVREVLGTNMNVARAGAGGGIAAGLLAFAGAELRSGFESVAEAMQLRPLIAAADVVVTGEGSFDEQSLAGKAPAGVARIAHEAGVPCLGIFGRLDVPVPQALGTGFSDVFDLTSVAAGPKADPAETLSRGAELLFGRQPF
ncbi:MAG TPA: glycerate kinase [Actinomycetota bacterium]|nr:glycerate kinase [Actinomycetota bacterium]